MKCDKVKCNKVRYAWIFLEQFKIHRNIKGGYRDFWCTFSPSCAQPFRQPPPVDSTHHRHSEPIVNTLVHSWCWTSYGFGQMCNSLTQSLWYPQNVFTDLGILILIDFWILNQSCVPGINPTWYWCINIFIDCWIQFADVLLKNFTFMFIRGIGL